MTARILVADGVATTRITLKVRLAAACYDVLTASTPDQLMAQARSHRPDLILLGGGFAGRESVQICRALVEDRDCAAIPVLMLADSQTRLDALRAGASAVLDPAVDEQMLAARIRGLLRDAGSGLEPQRSMAEAAVSFTPAPSAIEIALVADSAARALRWRHLLQRRLPHRFSIRSPEEALGAAASGRAADLYLIAADIGARGEGLRLLSELRSRSGSRDAAFVVATEADRVELSAVALDLGAGEVVPIDLGGGAGVEIVALALQTQLSRKEQGDRRRAEAQRNMIWAMTDPLTGLYNRRYALPRLTEIARDALRDGHSFAVLALDLDRFKRINDRHGHAAGDAVLREVARRLEQITGKDGITARLGGEEFLSVLPDACDSRAYRRAEEIRRAIETTPIDLPDLSGGGHITVTLSVGVAIGRSFGMAMPPDRLAELSLERADRALLLAKSMGRNRVMLAQAERAA
ncbi:diguanylate cyclase [Paracoccus spongiarum]|uniref:diguanylate cyclase n=1 Tax=Paracoccus spongiarum TaxID=3064387 RepID=A0ABT9JBV0_9RHOB|nr:diguanylate cyclase [Paracoccus sp. 2205BS29-5]MDP5307205.1 diguanylate cyclase [Paracoccus sp. 2205BS29-5]